MKTKEYVVTTRSMEFKNHVCEVIKEKYGIDVSYDFCVSAYYVRFIADKKTYKDIKKELGLVTKSVYVQREMD